MKHIEYLPNESMIAEVMSLEHPPDGTKPRRDFSEFGYKVPGWYFWDETWAFAHGPYPTEVEAKGKMLEYTKHFVFESGPVPAHQHTNPDGSLGGWVADTATVDSTAYVGYDARVFGSAKVFGSARVHGNARVYGSAKVYGNARVYGDAKVYERAKVYGDAWVYEHAELYEYADLSENAAVSGNAKVYGDAKVYGHAWVYGNAWVYGSARVHEDAKVYGHAWVCGHTWVCGNAEVYERAELSEIIEECLFCSEIIPSSPAGIEILRTLQKQIHEIAVEKGWYETNPTVQEALLNIHGEVSELSEALRNHNPSSEKIPKFSLAEEEAADIIIRVLDTATYNKWDVAGAILAKMEYNKTRSYRHGGKLY